MTPLHQTCPLIHLDLVWYEIYVGNKNNMRWIIYEIFYF